MSTNETTFCETCETEKPADEVETGVEESFSGAEPYSVCQDCIDEFEREIEAELKAERAFESELRAGEMAEDRASDVRFV